MKLFKLNIVAISILIIGWIIYLIIIPKMKRKEIILEDLTKYSITEAEEYLNKNNLKYHIIEKDSSDIIQIIGSKPKAMTKIKEKTTVDIYISRPKEKVLNDYTDTFYNEAIEEINEYVIAMGLRLEIIYEERNDIAPNIIISQKQIGNTIELKVSKKKDVVVGNYIGMNINDIDEDIKKLNITYIYISSFVDFNTILRQSVYNKVLCPNNKNELIFYVSKGF